MKRVLIACEESQAVTTEFRKLGIEAFSCDLLPCSGNHPEWHFQEDLFEVVKREPKFDLIISFPPCTDLALSGARWFIDKRANGTQEKSIRFFFEVWKISNCSENPMGIMNGGKYIKEWFPELYKEMLDYGFPFKPSQIIQPYYFGDPSRKTTCLWLKDLPRLTHNKENYVEPELYTCKNGKTFSKDYMVALKANEKRGHLRSKTYPGIAKNMAEQWSKFLKDGKEI